ncbi:UDP-N-acetylmuramoylalanyl-D-glutamyl-2,6-diamin opimelate/D-alanyl-D-alanylligase [Desulfofarcimen acetoxidans DSM 771]|uniref:UDP-N-acetylmuramoyl-tripeptide--D-alanyl-D-alanine ligase n=1 Tax=Desulfofarcimen acetoxidans (strain ATCC 49208 / DSM 771 / KCTC 5769 / VKM B-1644 / 5575) TaxID=485916 RepID=C8W469_DESAS|nr:UDP-N-acetylmuramoyl-tripeptide--D-alanyl-D-alanine ligase [Desulfofarcimen acetoxidans]ACV61937.1 UDP-N-acetylmuramoylalanyl-D-glutamyl-2,6-diamin opimelate/D-alanyl-D-alanylligase [Desulfofarcimen acetoxidans DSM 771]
MKTMSLDEIAGVIGARQVQKGSVNEVSSVCTDTRRLKPGELFFALKGENYDANDFVEQGKAKQAAAVVVSRVLSAVNSGTAVLQVQDSLKALQALARYNRQLFNIPVIGVTGSNGKTSTKDMIASVLGVRYKTLKTSGNYNNEIGLPLTLLSMDSSHQTAVVEMAMRGRGEIDFLCQLARPTGAVITCIGEAHLELLGSRENIAAAKGEMLQHIGPQGFALLSGNSSLTRQLAGLTAGKVLFYGTEPQLDIRACDIQTGSNGSKFTVITSRGQEDIFLPIPGRHNIINSLAAVGVGLELGLSLPEIKAGLAEVVLTGMRMEIIKINGITVINDVYNANPDSSKAALTTLADLGHNRRKIAVLGSMFELGCRAVEGHREVGRAAFAAGTEYLVTVGELARQIAVGAKNAGMPADRIFVYEDKQRACDCLGELCKKEDVILVKGSRGMHMEEVVSYLAQ